jgi:hypothetical protein
METTSKPKVTIAAISYTAIPYTAIPINLFHGKIDTSAKTNIKSNRAQPYTTTASPTSANDDSTNKSSRKPCSNCNKHSKTTTQTTEAATYTALTATTATSEQTTATNIKLSTMFNGSPSAMLIVPFMQSSNLSGQRQQTKSMPTFYKAQHQHHPPSLSKDLSRVSSYHMTSSRFLF